MPRDVFVSHASEDHALAGQVCELLEQRGLTCWIAPRDVGAGVEWDEAILDAIERSRAYLLLLSASANRSSFVKNELNRAFSSSKPIVTFRIEDVMPGRSLELYLARHHWTDAFPPPLEPKVDQLTDSLKQLLNHSADGAGDGSAKVPATPAAQAPQPKAKPSPRPSPLSGHRNGWMLIAAAAVLGMAAMALPTLHHLRETPPPETRVDIVTPATGMPRDFALSPDGRQIAFVGLSQGQPRLWIRSLATANAQPLPGTEGATAPFWSPDGRSIAFFAAGSMKRLDLGSGQPQTLATVGVGADGAWGSDGYILFSPGRASTFMRIPAVGGAMTEITRSGPQGFSHHFPRFLSDGKRFLYTAAAGSAPGIYLGSLDGRTPVRVNSEVSPVAYLPTGWMLWIRGNGGALVAQRLDPEKATLTGDPVTIADGVVAMSVASTGPIAYRVGTERGRQLQWMDRSGAIRGAIGEPDNTLNSPRVSPDGRRVALDRQSEGNTDIWLLDGARASRMTFNAAREAYSAWSPDGTRIVFTSQGAGIRGGDLYQKLASGAGANELLLTNDRFNFPSSWSADGRFLLYFSGDPQTQLDLWVMPMTGEHKPFVFLKTPFGEVWGQFSPDGRWVAYQSNESGRDQVYVRPFVPPGSPDAAHADGGQWQVSTNGGVHPVWRSDGKELYFLDPAGEMMAAPITVSGSTLQPGALTRLFQTRIVGGGVDSTQGRQYDVAPDGRFLINTELDSDAAAPITLIQNWNPDAGK